MPIDRRTFCLAFAGVLASREAPAKSVAEQGLFWSAASEGKPSSILFGYARTAATVAPDIVNDGRKFALQCATIAADVGNTQLPKTSVDRNKMTPILDWAPPPLAQKIRSVLAQSFANWPDREKITGLELMLLLQGEGQTPAQASVGGTIMQDAQAAGKPFSTLLTAAETLATYHAPDLIALDKRINADAIGYLLTLRDSVGTIGKRQESLYAARHVGELSKLTDDLKAHGVLSFADVTGLDADRLSAAVVDRALAAIRNATAPQFLLLPVGTLTDVGGVLDKARNSGLQLKLLA
jgi:hypothetical protein